MKIKLWLENLVANEYEEEVDDLAREFAGSDYNRGARLDWPAARRFGTWIACDKNSAIDPENIDVVLDVWRKLPREEQFPNGLED